MNLIIRKEIDKDFNDIYNLVKNAFENCDHSDGNEHNLVEKLRKSENYIPKLSLVAVESDKIVGYIMLTKLYIKDNNNIYESLALAPLAVSPEYQNKGIGSNLVREALKLSKKLEYKNIFVLGSENYYPRFGFKEAINFGIKAPFEVLSKNFMAIELIENSLKDISGELIYAKEFFE